MIFFLNFNPNPKSQKMSKLWKIKKNKMFSKKSQNHQNITLSFKLSKIMKNNLKSFFIWIKNSSKIWKKIFFKNAEDIFQMTKKCQKMKKWKIYRAFPENRFFIFAYKIPFVDFFLCFEKKIQKYWFFCIFFHQKVLLFLVKKQKLNVKIIIFTLITTFFFDFFLIKLFYFFYQKMSK